MKRFATVFAVALAPALASAQEVEWRLDHRNQPSLLGVVGAEHLVVTSGVDEEDEQNDTAAVADVAFGIPVNDEGAELFLGVRFGTDGDRTRLVAPHLFYRVYAGEEEWKTFFDAGLLLRIEPLVAGVARIGLGGQYDFHENFGLYVTAGASLGYGQGLNVGIDGGLGLQFRFGTAG